jgi:flagellar biosynthesis anti-sigma factor FlgM
MKIEDRVSDYTTLLNSGSAKPTTHNSDVSTAAAAKAVPDAVDLSGSAVQFSEDEARRERLNMIRQQLAEGSYNISGKDVAHKMLNVLKG